jgi:hypothetical protein
MRIRILIKVMRIFNAGILILHGSRASLFDSIASLFVSIASQSWSRLFTLMRIKIRLLTDPAQVSATLLTAG